MGPPTLNGSLKFIYRITAKICVCSYFLERFARSCSALSTLTNEGPALTISSIILIAGRYACTIEEGRLILARLQEQSTQPPFIYNHKWQKGDLLIWDNRCLMHRGISNYQMATEERVLKTKKADLNPSWYRIASSCP